jgi:hypothetical protein
VWAGLFLQVALLVRGGRRRVRSPQPGLGGALEGLRRLRLEGDQARPTLPSGTGVMAVLSDFRRRPQ